MKEPARGALSAGQAAQYLQCGMEGEKAGDLYLIESVNLEVGKGTPWQQLNPANRSDDGDKDGLVYSIRGSFLKYQCDRVYHQGSGKNEGKNCRVYPQNKVEGSCYRTNFGDWSCNMVGSPSSVSRSDQAPPQ